MPVHLDRVAAALNAYPWTPGTLTHRADGAPRYCAVGALLRYAGVAQDHIACVSGTAGAHDLWHLYGALLKAEYGIANAGVARLIMAANDSAASQAEAIERVLWVVVAGARDRGAVMRLDAAAADPEAAEPGQASAVARGQEPDDGAGSLALAT
jgi:alcohol dehydrogenase class IV